MGDVSPVRVDVEHAVEAAVEVVVVAQLAVGDVPHPGHDAHAQDDVEGIRQFHAHLGQRRPRRAHEIGDDVHGASPHRALAERAQLLVHLPRRHPVVGRPGLLLFAGADVGRVLDPGDVVRVGAMIVAAGQLFLVELNENPGLDRLGSEDRTLRRGAVAPVNAVGLAQLHHLGHPVGDGLVARVALS